MASSLGNFPQTSGGETENFDHYTLVSKYGRHKDENGRWVSNNSEPPFNANKFGEGRGQYVVEERDKFSKERRPEAGSYMDFMLAENFTIDGAGKDVSVVNSFEEMNLDPLLYQNIRGRGYEKPLPIQRATYSLIQAGYDVIGHAVTGGGKTAAFLIPIIDYILKAKRTSRSTRAIPLCIVISPTKELAEQIYEDTRVFAKGLNCKPVLSFGEIPRRENVEDIKKGCDMFICTVGRLCDYLANDALKLNNLRFLVFDEADKLFLMSTFYNDLVENLLPRTSQMQGLQNLLFSATDCANLDNLKEIFLNVNATTVVVGEVNAVTRFVTQIVIKVEVEEKRDALLELMQEMYANGDAEDSPPKTIIFVNTRRLCTTIATYLSLKGYKAYPICGSLTATLRREGIEALQSGECHILVSTDVTARGMDIRDVSHVINYDMPVRDTWASYIHRVGRTGRVGNVGRATTFFAPSVDNGMALILYGWLEMSGQEIPTFLAEEAQRQADTEDLQKKAMEEYERALDESYLGSSDDDDDDEADF